MRNPEISEVRYLGASALAATVPSGILLALALCAVAIQSWWGTGSELDDAPMRVVGIAMVLSVPMFVFFLVVFYFSARVLALLRWLSFGSLAFVSIVFVSTALYWQTLGLNGWRAPELQANWPFAIFWLVLGSFTLLATYIWCRVAHNPSFKRDALKRAP
jgi:hypothetical protein